MLKKLTLLLTVLASFVLASCSNESEEYYSGKTINIYVGRTPGSGADLAVRLFARYWADYVPGNPNIVVRNVPGGGGTRVWNFGVEGAENNGLDIMFSPTAGIEAVLQEPGLRANFSEMPFVGGLMSPNMAYISTQKVSQPGELLSAEGLVFGGQNPIARFDLLGRLALDSLGVNYNYVTGFQGASDVLAAVRRNEVDIQVASLGLYRFSVESLVEQGLAIPLWHNPGTDINGNLYELEVASDIPSFEEFYEELYGELPSDEFFEVYKWVLPRVNDIVYAAMVPPGTSQEHLGILREAFVAVTNDANYQAQEITMYGFNLPVINVSEGETIMSGLYDVPDDIHEFLTAYIDQVR
jgi:tripartite-type tricarboxylate transporter receptor subunit TctC